MTEQEFGEKYCNKCSSRLCSVNAYKELKEGCSKYRMLVLYKS